ncbi:MAG: hypothetical protein JWM68_4651, partial [Verrucomicrobiales bacterium]|nr:hypothetical protein [Verrucomicrobiales bacterium]
MEDMTPIQRKVFEFIQEGISTGGAP